MPGVGVTISKIVRTGLSPVPANALLDEDGKPILTEDGKYILLETT